MATLDQLAERLEVLVQGVRAPWSDEEIAVARDAWNAYDRDRLRVTGPLEASMAGYVTLRGGGSSVPHDELAAALEQISEDVDAVLKVLDRAEDDLYATIADRNRDAIRIIDQRRMTISDLRGGYERWLAELRAEARVSELQAPGEGSECGSDPDTDPDSSSSTQIDESSAEGRSGESSQGDETTTEAEPAEGLASDPAVASALGAAVYCGG